MIEQHFQTLLLALALIGIGALMRAITKTEKTIMAKVKDLAGQLADLNTKLGAVSDQLTKATGEIVTEIETLKTALEDADLPGDAQASLDALTAKVNALAPIAQALDDMNPDAPATTTPAAPPTN